MTITCSTDLDDFPDIHTTCLACCVCRLFLVIGSASLFVGLRCTWKAVWKVSLVCGSLSTSVVAGGGAFSSSFFCVVLLSSPSFGWWCVPLLLLLGGAAFPPSFGWCCRFPIVFYEMKFNNISIPKQYSKILNCTRATSFFWWCCHPRPPLGGVVSLSTPFLVSGAAFLLLLWVVPLPSLGRCCFPSLLSHLACTVPSLPPWRLPFSSSFAWCCFPPSSLGWCCSGASALDLSFRVFLCFSCCDVTRYRRDDECAGCCHQFLQRMTIVCRQHSMRRETCPRDQSLHPTRKSKLSQPLQ